MADEDDEDSKQGLEKPTDHMHKGITKIGMLMMGFAVILLVSPIWDAAYKQMIAEHEIMPIKQNLIDINKELADLTAIDPTSAKIENLKMKRMDVQAQLSAKGDIYNFHKKHIMVLGLIIAVCLLFGLIITFVGLYLWYDYRAQFAAPVEKKGGDEDDDE